RIKLSIKVELKLIQKQILACDVSWTSRLSNASLFSFQRAFRPLVKFTLIDSDFLILSHRPSWCQQLFSSLFRTAFRF
ncbi:MAG: hypothetical protein ACM32O_17325, partial [Clostridia bacterium]